MPITYLTLLVASCVIAYWPTWDALTFFPEDPLFYSGVARLDLRGLLAQYGDFPAGASWYRPTTFFTVYWLLSRAFDWHDLLAFRLAHFTIFLSFSVSLFFAVRGLLRRLDWAPKVDENRVAFLVAILYSLSPILFSPLFHVTAFDFLHQLLVLGCLCAFVRATETAGPRRAAWIAIFLVAQCLALTSKEVTIVLVALQLWLLHALRPRSLRPLIAPVLLSGALTLAYVVFAIPKMSYSGGGSYRTGFDLVRIRVNFTHFCDWILRHYQHPDGHLRMVATPLARSVGYLLTALLLVAGYRSRRVPGFGRFVVWCLAGCAITLAIPMYAGGYPWHFALPSIAIYLAAGVAYERAGLGRWNARSALAATTALAVVLTIQAGSGYRRFISDGPFSDAYRYDREALLRPPVPREQVTSGTRLFIRNKDGRESWSFGGGTLFRYVYKQPSLEQRLIQELAVDQLPGELEKPSTYCVDWDNTLGKWLDVTSDCLRDAREAQAAQARNSTQPTAP